MTYTMKATLGTPRPAGSPDFFRTPPEYVRDLLQNEYFSVQILEPAAGDGAIVEVLKDYGYLVTHFDKYMGKARRDFFEWNIPAANIITNPPYGRKGAEMFIDHALEIATEKVAMLLRLTFLEGQGRKIKFQERWPLQTVYVLTKRWNFASQTWGGATAYAWFVFDKSWRPNDAKVRWI